MGIFRTSSREDTVSNDPERIALRRWGEESCYIEVLQQRASSWNIKKRLLLFKTRYPKLRDFALFYVWEDAGVWAHWNHSFQMYFSYMEPLSGVSRLPRWLSGKESTCWCRRHRRHGSIPGLGRSPGIGSGKPLQYSCLESFMDRGAWWATVCNPLGCKELVMTEHACTFCVFASWGCLPQGLP